MGEVQDINQTWQKMTGSEDDLAQSAVDVEITYDYMGNKSLVFGIHTAENPLTISFASISERISDDLYSRGIILDTGIFSQEALCYVLSKELEENFNGYYLREEFFTEQLKEYREDFDRLTESMQDIVKNFAHLILSELHLPQHIYNHCSFDITYNAENEFILVVSSECGKERKINLDEVRYTYRSLL